MSPACAQQYLVAVEDYIVGAPYEVKEVDGHPPERAKHGMFVTVVPVVLVTPGLHEFTLERREIGFQENNTEPVKLLFTVVSGQRYRLALEKGKPTLVVVDHAKNK